MPSDEEDAESSPDIPSFGDLVKQIQEREEAEEYHDNESNDRSNSANITDIESATSDQGVADVELEDEAWKWGDSETQSAEGPQEPDNPRVDSLWEDSHTASDQESIEGFEASKHEAMLELVHGASNILLEGPAGTPREHELCAKLTDLQSGEVRRRLLITTNQSADERLGSLKPFTDDPFDETILLVVGDQGRSNGSPSPISGEDDGQKITIENLTDPRDLTRMGVLINRYLGQHEEPPVICFHSLNELHQFVGMEKLFRFLHILQSRVRSVDGHAHFQIDPETLQSESVATLGPLFDFVISYDQAGSLSIDPV